MTEEKEEKAVVTTKRPDAPAEWHSRGEIMALGERIRAMMPGGDKLDANQAMALAQYSAVMDLNPFRGEVYAFPGRGGQLCIVDGYKALVRWAKQKSAYVDKYEALALSEGLAHHIRCWILRDDRRQEITEWIALGAPWREAFELVATFGDGVVSIAETKREAPTGWTWEQVARKRALKNALNLSHGAPSPRELAAMSWEVNGVKTLPEDWRDIPEHIIKAGLAPKAAEMEARARESKTAWEQMTDEEKDTKFHENVTLLRGEETDDPFGIDAPPQPSSEPPAGPIWQSGLFDEEPPSDEEQAEESPPTGPTLAEQQLTLLAKVNAKTDNRYRHIRHLLNAIKLELGEEWTWPGVDNTDAWNAAYRAAVSHAKKEV
jgi:hypothetical protein